MASHDETPGERAVKAELKHLKLNFEQEKTIRGLKGDTKSFRVADFYLPDYDVYIEFLGEWDNQREKQRYKEKMRVYKLNDIKCIWIYPNQLTHTHKVIQEGLIKYGIKLNRHGSKPSPKPKPKKNYKPLIITCFISLIIASLLYTLIINENENTLEEINGKILVITNEDSEQMQENKEVLIITNEERPEQIEDNKTFEFQKRTLSESEIYDELNTLLLENIAKKTWGYRSVSILAKYYWEGYNATRDGLNSRSFLINGYDYIVKVTFCTDSLGVIRLADVKNGCDMKVTLIK